MQNMRGRLLYGYNLNQVLEFRVTSGLLMNIRDARVKKLSDTSARLLRFFIEGARSGLVSDDDIARIVFESAGLKGSSSRIRGVIRDLKDAFRDLGFHSDFISRHTRQGYYVHFDKIEFLIALDNSMEWPYDSGFYTEYVY